MKRYDALPLLGISLASLICRVILLPPPNLAAFDETTYSDVVRALITNDFLPGPANALLSSAGHSYFTTNPPLFAYILAIPSLVFGYSIDLGRIIVILFGVATIFPLFYLTKDMFSKNTAIIASGICAFFPINLVIGSWITPSAVDTFFIVCSLYFYWKESKSSRIYSLTYAFLFVSFLIDLWGLLVVFSVILLGLIGFDGRRVFRPANFIALLASASPVIVATIYWSTSGIGLVLPGSSLSMLMYASLSSISRQLLDPTITPLFAIYLGALGFLFLLFKRGKAALFMSVVVICAILTVAASGVVSEAATTGRFLIPFIPVLSILAACSITEIGVALASLDSRGAGT